MLWASSIVCIGEDVGVGGVAISGGHRLAIRKDDGGDFVTGRVGAVPTAD